MKIKSINDNTVEITGTCKSGIRIEGGQTVKFGAGATMHETLVEGKEITNRQHIGQKIMLIKGEIYLHPWMSFSTDSDHAKAVKEMDDYISTFIVVPTTNQIDNPIPKDTEQTETVCTQSLSDSSDECGCCYWTCH